jgi:hypothetical protein
MANFGADSMRHLEIVSMKQLLVNQQFGAVSKKSQWTRSISPPRENVTGHPFCARSGLLQRPACRPVSVTSLILPFFIVMFSFL